ncbi:hypothetical protein ACFJGW_19235 [Burkholderiaceae bacterium UC74_6]
MTLENPYAPPKTPLAWLPEEGSARGAAKGGFPWLMVLRWIVGLGVLLTGLYGAYALSQAWASLNEQAIILPQYAPIRLLPALLLKIATGVAILLRTRWCVALAVGWTVALADWIVGGSPLGNFPWQVLIFGTVEQLAVVAFLCLLWLRGRLR